MSGPLRTVMLIRHPETVANAERRFLGSGDSPYTVRGELQREALRAAIRDFEPDAAFISPSARALAALSGSSVDAAQVIVLDGLREIDFGTAEGCTFDEATERGIGIAYDGDGPVAPGGERLGAFRRRVARVAETVASRDAERVAVVTHGGVMRQLLGAWLGLPDEAMWELEIPPGCIVVVRIHPGGAVLESLRTP